LATGGDIRGSFLQFFDLAVSALLYYPFFKAWERVLVARESAQEELSKGEDSKDSKDSRDVQPLAVGTH
jgi:PTS system cellobiose-specific IIC component